MTKTWLGTTDRYARLRRIEELDLDTDYREITLLFYADFRSVIGLQGFHSFLFTYASPRISRVLTATGELEQRVAKRILDTTLLATTVMMNGLGPGPGRDAARRVNAMHKQYDIHGEDFVAVGVDEAVASIQLAERYGWRPVTDREREATRRYYEQQARAFGSHLPFPATVPEMMRFWSGYLDRQARFEPQNRRLADATVGHYAGLMPRVGRPLFIALVLATVEPRVLRACGLPVRSRPVRALATRFMKVLSRTDPMPDDAPNPLEDMAREIYPHGFEIGELGTHVPGA